MKPSSKSKKGSGSKKKSGSKKGGSSDGSGSVERSHESGGGKFGKGKGNWAAWMMTGLSKWQGMGGMGGMGRMGGKGMGGGFGCQGSQLRMSKCSALAYTVFTDVGSLIG